MKTLIFSKNNKPESIIIRAMQSSDYAAFCEVVQDVWPGVSANTEHDFIAIVDQGISFAAIDQSGEMLGTIFNMLRPSKNRKFHILVHMLGVKKNARGQGIGQQLLTATYDLIRNDALGKDVNEICLTSDPLESKNVKFYLHYFGMTAHEYKLNAYKNLSQNGGAQHRGLSSDRFVYSVDPNCSWAKNRILPSKTLYRKTANNNPHAVINMTVFSDFNELENLQKSGHLPPVLFIETPENIEAVKKQSMEKAKRWRAFHAKIFPLLFSPQFNYSALDTAVLEESGQRRLYVILVRDFDEFNQNYLIQMLSKF